MTVLDCAEAATDMLPARDRRLLEPLGAGAARWVGGAVERALDVLRAESHDALAPRPAIRAFASHVLTAALLVLGGDHGEPARVEVIDPDLVEDIVARDIPLADVTAALRTMQRVWLALLLDTAVEATPDGVSTVPAIVGSLTATMDTWVAVVVEAIAEERRRVFQTEQVRVRTAVEMLVAGEPVDPDNARRLLGLPLAGWHVCCVVGVPPGGLVERWSLDSIVHAFTRASGGKHVLRYETSAGTVRLWSTTDRRSWLPGLADLQVPEPFAIGLGESHRGLEGFRRTFVEADDAFQFAIRGGAGRVVSYTDEALAIVLTRDEERARWFVESVLGELGADRPDMAEMRNTLRAFFDTRMRIAPAAELLHVHRNTLINRLERIEAVIGHGVAERSAQTQAALLLAELFAAGR